MRIGLVVNVESEKCIRHFDRVLRFLEGRNADIVLEEGIAGHLKRDGVPLSDMKTDVIITLGGDGTILRTLQRTKAKILGINVGVLGFLTELKLDEVESGLEKLMANQFTVDRRSKLKVTVDDKRLSDCTNEAVIHTAHVGKMRRFGIRIDEQLASDVRADGIIVATSTGSTCYAMSVGGPIIDPKVDAIVIAPIAPFKLAARPMVVSTESKVKIELIEPGSCVLVLDGQEEVGLEGSEVVSFGSSENKAEFVRFGESFYKRIREKLGG